MLNLNTGYNLTGCDTQAACNTRRCQGYGASVCKLKPCVRIYNATINAGHLDERLISQSNSSNWGVNPMIDIYGVVLSIWLATVDIQCISEEESDALRRQGYKIDKSSRWIPFNMSAAWSWNLDNYTYGTWSWSDNNNGRLAPSLQTHKCLYLIQNDDASNFTYWQSILGDNFFGTVQADGDVIGGGPHNLDYYSVFSLTGLQMLVALYNNGDISFDSIQNIFANLSDIMTAWIRMHGNATYSEDATSQVLHDATFLSIQWPWLSFSATPALLTLILLS